MAEKPFDLKDLGVITHDDLGEIDALHCLKCLCEIFACQVQPTGLCIAEGDYCGYTIFYSSKLKTSVFYNPESQQYETLPMGIQTTPYKPSDSQICAEAQYAAFELLTGATDVGTVIADVLAANPLIFDVAGNEVAVTADDVQSIKITPKACGTMTSTGVEIEIDFINVNGTAASNFNDMAEGGVDAATTIEVPVGGCAVVDVCFKKCWSKQEVSALGA